ncbi:MAG: glycosyltransferase family 2 protein, partial [Burkholderiales bacterium]
VPANDPDLMRSTTGANVFVVIVTYNGAPWIGPCLQSLLASTESVEAIVVDNASTDDTLAIVERDFPATTVLRSAENLGFGRGNNLGIRHALALGARYVFLLNQDAFVLPATVAELRGFMDAHPEFGVASPLHCSPDLSQLDRRSMRGYLQAYLLDYLGDACVGRVQGHYKTFGINAAAWFVRAETFRTAGGFDPLFLMYGEDDDLLHRWAHHNIGFALLTGSRIVHLRQSPSAPRVGFWGDVRRRAQRARSELLTQIKRPGHSGLHMVSVLISAGFVAPLAQALVVRSGRDYLGSLWAALRLVMRWPALIHHARLTARRGSHFL